MTFGDPVRIETVPTEGHAARRVKRVATLRNIAHGRAILDMGGMNGTREFALKSGHSFGSMRDWRIEPDQMDDLRALAKELKAASKVATKASTPEPADPT